MIFKTTVFLVLVLSNAAFAYNGLAAFARPTLRNVFTVAPRVRVLKNEMQRNYNAFNPEEPTPKMVFEQQAPQMAYGQQEPQMAYGQQEPQMVFEQQKPHMAYGQQAPQMAYGQQAPQMAYGQQAPPQALANTCKIGMVEPIHAGTEIMETYCRCPSGTYGLSCEENFFNPCQIEGATYHPADPSIGPHYFIECNWNTPYLFKCPAGLVWNQEIDTCDWQQGDSVQTPGVQTPGVQTPGVQAPAYEAPSVQAPAYEAPSVQAPAYETPRFEAPRHQTPAYTAPRNEAPRNLEFTRPAY